MHRKGLLRTPWSIRDLLFGQLLLEFLPVLSAKESAETSSQRWAFIVCRVRMKYQSAVWGWKPGSLFIGKRTADTRGRDVCDLVSIHEAKTIFGLDRYAVKQIELRYLQNVLNLSDGRSRGSENGSSDFKSHV